MKIKYTGDMDEITLRHVTFERGKGVEMSDDPRDVSLAKKCLALPYFEEVKRGRKAKADDENEG